MTDTNPDSSGLRRALVVDDEPEIAEFVADVLALCAFDVEFVTTAAAVHERNPAEYNLVVLDLVMPAEDGVALLPFLATATPMPQLILMSGEAGGVLEEAKASAENLGMMVLGFLRKPFFSADLEALLDAG